MLKIKTNSKLVEPGDTFVAIKGFTVDGHSFIPSAIQNGATKIVCEYGEYDNAEVMHVDDTQKWLHDYLLENYSKEILEMTFIGVTGTNGKTTTCFLTYETLIKMGVNACYIGTIGYYDKDTYHELPNTTPSMIDLYTIILNAKEKGIDTVVMEISSHSLVEKRIDGIKYNAVGYTNLTQDHLDFHKTMENYFEAKLQLLNYLKKDAKVIINEDDEYFKTIKNQNKFSYGFEGKDLKIQDFKNTDAGTTIEFVYQDQNYKVNTLLKNRFNVYNYLMSLSLIMNLGFQIDEIIGQSDKINPPKGRCETLTYKNSNIIIDYAHTPDAVQKIIASFKETTSGRIITIFGCGGDRDKTKRPIMGKIASENSDFVIVTSDNPRTEDPETIINEIMSGIITDNYIKISDRKEAIKHGIDMLEVGDTLLILGKGHENYQIIGKVKYPFDDKEIANNYIAEKTK